MARPAASADAPSLRLPIHPRCCCRTVRGRLQARPPTPPLCWRLSTAPPLWWICCVRPLCSLFVRSITLGPAAAASKQQATSSTPRLCCMRSAARGGDGGWKLDLAGATWKPMAPDRLHPSSDGPNKGPLENDVQLRHKHHGRPPPYISLPSQCEDGRHWLYGLPIERSTTRKEHGGTQVPPYRANFICQSERGWGPWLPPRKELGPLRSFSCKPAAALCTSAPLDSLRPSPTIACSSLAV